MKQVFLLFFLIFSFSISYAQETIVLVSYPKSGNIQMRYFLEFLTKRPSFYIGNVKLNKLPQKWEDKFFDFQSLTNQPLSLFYHFDIDYSKPPIIQLHKLNHKDSKKVKVIFLIRNYFECLVEKNRHLYSPLEALEAEAIKGRALSNQNYFELIQQYDLYKGPKILIFYEDLATNTKLEIEKVLIFLKEPNTHLPELMEKIEEDKNMVAAVKESLKGTNSKQNNPDLTQEEKIYIQSKVMARYPLLWDKYLKRYAIN